MADFLFVPFCALFVVSLVVSGLGALLAWTMTSSTKFVLHATDENESSGDGAIAHMIDEESLSLGFGLTERESQAISLMLQGKTSREAAEMMGVKPSTVRNYLQRAYAKASVSSSSEMRELLCPAVGDDCPLEAEAAMTTPSGHSGWMLAFLPVLAICLGCFFAFGSEGQVLEHAVVLGLGFGLFLCGSLSLTREISCGAGFNLVTSRKLLALSTLISSLLLGVSVLLYVLSGLILSCSLLAVSCCLFACSLVSLSRMIEAELDSNRIQFMGQGDVALSIIGASLLPGYSLGYFCERPFDAFSAVVIVTSLLIFAIFFIAIARYGKGHSSMMSISFASFGVGLGMVAGCVTADRFVEYLLVSADEPFMPGVFTPFASTPVVTTLIALISLVGIAYLAFVGRFSYCPEVSGVIHERIVHYLMARGLSDRESEVVALISEGFTGSQIAVKMHYSLGSVNAMRLAGYRILGIHSKSELDSLLKESVGIER